MTERAVTVELPALMTLAEFSRRTGVSATILRRCIHATDPLPEGWPPLAAKRGPRGRFLITGPAGAAWINALPEA